MWMDTQFTKPVRTLARFNVENLISIPLSIG